MFVVAFSGFVVETQNANLIDHKGQPVFESMATARNRPRQAPDHKFDKAVFGNDPSFPEEQPCHAVGVYANSMLWSSELLLAEEFGVALTEEDQLDPEQSTSAIVVHHPQAKYFSV